MSPSKLVTSWKDKSFNDLWCNGSTTDFDSVCLGSNPGRSTKTITMDKVIKDGKVAVIISTNWGSGWSTWNPQYPQLAFEPKVVQMILDGRQEEITQQWLIDNLGLHDVWIPSPDTLEIVWVPQGTRFLIQEYDGFESVILEEDLQLYTA